MQNQNKKNYGIALFLILIGFTFNSHGDEFDNEQPTVLITGSNRNIGLEFVKEFSKRNWNVIATTRRPDDAKELNKFAAKYNIKIFKKSKKLNLLIRPKTDRVFCFLAWYKFLNNHFVLYFRLC